MSENIVIIGGTGTLGQALIRQYLVLNSVYERSGVSKKKTIYCLSRDELKQKELKAKFPELRLVIGDIRDESSLESLPHDIEKIYHVAALKHIEIAEENPAEALKINVIGTQNVANFAIKRGVKSVCFSSTDKAVFPINVYGNTKAICEKYLLDLNNKQSDTCFYVFRWGNVLGSRGSVIHSFAKTLKEHKKVYITDPRMTRFWIDIDKAASFMTCDNHSPIKIIIPEMKAAEVTKIARAVAYYLGLGMGEYDTEVIGIRAGEKLHEDIDEYTNSEYAEKYTFEELLAFIGNVL